MIAKFGSMSMWETDGPRPISSYDSMFSFRDALQKISNGARFKVLTFEFNSNSHSQKRALANALAIQGIERDGQIPIATAANALQPDGQNDNGWNQGLLFLNPSRFGYSQRDTSLKCMQNSTNHGWLNAWWNRWTKVLMRMQSEAKTGRPWFYFS